MPSELPGSSHLQTALVFCLLGLFSAWNLVTTGAGAWQVGVVAGVVVFALAGPVRWVLRATLSTAQLERLDSWLTLLLVVCLPPVLAVLALVALSFRTGLSAVSAGGLLGFAAAVLLEELPDGFQGAADL